MVTDKGDVMRVRGEALANNGAPAVDCTLAATTGDPEADDGLCGVDNGLVAPCVPLPVPPGRLVLLAPLELWLLPLLAGTFIAIPLKLFFPTVPVDDEFVIFEGA